MSKIFSLPYYPGLTADEIDNMFIPFLNDHKQYIYDFYFTCRMPPFIQDAMGTLWDFNDSVSLIRNALYIQEKTGIVASAVFNNIYISPSYDNYKMFCHNFKELYDNNIRSITLPFTSWLYFGFKDLFPDVFVKNTVLWTLDDPAKLYKTLEAGFDYINLDRNLIRNSDRLEELKEAKKIFEKERNKHIDFSLLFNENCRGMCSIQQEHYIYNINNNFQNQINTWFNSEMNKISCKQNDSTPINLLKTSNVPGYYSYINHLLKYIQVFKLHGREEKSTFLQSLYIISCYSSANPMTNDIFNKVFIDFKISNKIIKQWLNHIKNCKFQCYRCNYCETILNCKDDKNECFV